MGAGMNERDAEAAGRHDGSVEPGVGELVEAAVRKLVTALVLSSGILALAIYSRPGPPRYQAIAADDGRIVRINTRSGTILACEADRCMRIVKRGQHLEKDLGPKAVPKPAPAAPLPAAPKTGSP